MLRLTTRSALTALLLLGCSFVLSCSDDPAATNTTSYTIQDIFPLAVGSKWQYRSTWLSQIGDTQSVTVYGHTIDSMTTFHGMPAYQSSAANGLQFFFYIGNDAFTAVAGVNESPFLVRYPMKKNEVYLIKDTIYSDTYHIRYSFRLLSENETLPIPGGELIQCLKYESLAESGYPGSFDTIDVTYKYFAPGIGLLRQELYNHQNTPTPYMANKTELLTYKK